MHDANLAWWKSVRDEYPYLFTGVRVLEAGSLDMNGSVRPLFTACDYVGLDWREGQGVDTVCLAHKFVTEQPFDVVISASMLEHDPYWQASLAALAQTLKPTGALLLSWGAAGNEPHDEHTAPDGEFHALPAGQVLERCAQLGLYVERFGYETDFGGGEGECGLVAFRDPASGRGEVRRAPLLPADAVGLLV